MLTLTNIPLSIFDRALELYGQPEEATHANAQAALQSAQGRKDFTPEFPGIDAFSQAVAEHMASGAGYSIA
jgi:hypothetical protein